MFDAITGFLFNRFSFFLIVLAVIAAFVFFGKLVWNKYVISGLVLLALGVGLWTWHDKAVEDDRMATAKPYIEMIKKSNDEAAAKLKEETDKTTAITKAFKEFSTLQEKTNATNFQTIVNLNAQHRNDRLRDPYQTGDRSCSPQTGNTGNTESSAGNGAETSGLFSEQASADIWSTDFEADRINVAYIACRAYAYKVRDTLIAQTDAGGIVLAMSELDISKRWAAP